MILIDIDKINKNVIDSDNKLVHCEVFIRYGYICFINIRCLYMYVLCAYSDDILPIGKTNVVQCIIDGK